MTDSDLELASIEEEVTRSLEEASSARGKPKRRPLIRVRSEQKSSWLCSAFEDTSTKKERGTKSGTASSKEVLGRERDQLWVDRHSPKNRSELAVHAKKVEEVSKWLSSHIDHGGILVLTGPPGVGKTATVRVLCSELGVHLTEWSHEAVGQSGEPTRLEDFLLRVDRYVDVMGAGDGGTDGGHKVLLIEEFPPQYRQSPAGLHQILSRHASQGHSPLVLILSDARCLEDSERWLFPRDLQQRLSVQNISFNPIANTLLVKALARVAKVECKWMKRRDPSKLVLETLASESNGDIRTAINQLQFALVNDQVASSASRDSTLFLFRALGKILYCKRTTDAVAIEEYKKELLARLPPHLAHHSRPPPTFCPESVVEQSRLPQDTFVCYLHENYPDFYSDIVDLSLAADHLSWTDAVCSKWRPENDLASRYSPSVACRGLMLTNQHRTGNQWRPLRQSELWEVRRVVERRRERAREVLSGGVRDALERLPFEVHLRAGRGWGPGERDLIMQLCKFSRFLGRSQSQLLERDCGFAQEDENLIGDTRRTNSSRSNFQSTNQEPDSSQWEFCVDSTEAEVLINEDSD